MSIGWTVVGTLGQLILAGLLFMLVAFSAGGLVSGQQFRRAHMRILDISLFALPGSCALGTLIVWYLHWAGAGVRSYGWFALPLAVTALYLVYFKALISQLARAR